MNIRRIVIAIVSGVLFLMVLPSISSAFIISGFVFDDVNCNGVRNAGDSGIAGVTIVLSPGPLITATSATGTYSFNVPPGTYTITEADPAGYCSTSANSRIVKVTIANVGGQHFADSKKPVSPPGGCCP